MRAHSSLRLGTLHGTTPELLASPCYCAWGFCMVWEAGLPHKTSSAPPQRRNGRACSSLTARGGGLPVGVTTRFRVLPVYQCRVARFRVGRWPREAAVVLAAGAAVPPPPSGTPPRRPLARTTRR